MLLSIVILNYNTTQLTKKCLQSICNNLNSKEYEIIVVDNGSFSENLNVLKTELLSFKNVKLILSNINKGFGGGNMLGFKYAKGDFVSFINSDVILIEDGLIPACQYLKEHADVGCVTLQQLNMDRQLIPSFDHGPSIKKEIVGKKFIEWLNPKKYPRRKDYQYYKPLPVRNIAGTLMIFPSDLFHRIGGFDKRIFLYYEEYDICTRLHKLGYASVLLPMYFYYHLHGATTDRNRKSKSKALCELYKSKFYVYKKHNNLKHYILYAIINLIKLSVKPRLWYILRKIKY
jgi:GT2 family glycosyltransferase